MDKITQGESANLQKFIANNNALESLEAKLNEFNFSKRIEDPFELKLILKKHNESIE